MTCSLAQNVAIEFPIAMRLISYRRACRWWARGGDVVWIPFCIAMRPFSKRERALNSVYAGGMVVSCRKHRMSNFLVGDLRFRSDEVLAFCTPVRNSRVINVDVAPSVYIASSHSLNPPPVDRRGDIAKCMRQLSRLLRANCFSSSLRPQFSTPPSLARPTKNFATTTARERFQVHTRKKDTVVMAGDMTTFKGKPFDRASLESLMKVRNETIPQFQHQSY